MQNSYVQCKYAAHKGKSINGICVNINCQSNRPYCSACMKEHHISHIQDLLDFADFEEWKTEALKKQGNVKRQVDQMLSIFQILNKFLNSVSADPYQNTFQMTTKEINSYVSSLCFIKGFDDSTAKYMEEAIQNLTSLKSACLSIKSLQEMQAEIFSKKMKMKYQNNMEEGQYINLLMNDHFQLISFTNGVFGSCDHFIAQLQEKMNKLNEVMQELQQKIRLRYQISEPRLIQLNNSQICEAVGEMMLFKETISLLNQEPTAQIESLSNLLNECIAGLAINKLSYCQISKNDQLKAKALFQSGYNLGCNEEYQEAILLFDQSLQLNPYDQYTLACKGDCLKLMSQYNESLIWLDKALEIDPKHIYSLRCKGECLKMMSQYNESLIWLEKILEIDPKYVHSLWCKGDCLKFMSQYNESLIWLDKALEIDPKHMDSLGCKGACLRLIGNIDEALVYLEQALQINPLHRYSICEKAACLTDQQKFSEAIILYDKALSIDPKYEFALNGRSKNQNSLEICQENLE